MISRRITLLFFILWMSACTPTATPSPTSPKASPRPTILASPAVTSPAPTASPPPTSTGESQIRPDTPTPLPTVTPEPPCVNGATYVADLTIPDGKQYLPGQTENKKWSVNNAGTCDWNASYRLVLVGGDSLGAPSEVALYPAKAGVAGLWEIPITAPLAPGVYTGKWQARDPAGNLFGDTVFIKIEVIPLPTATPVP